jgi:spoIIIJ-associated protein
MRTGRPCWGPAVNQAEDMLSDASGEDRGATVSTDSARTAGPEMTEPDEAANPPGTLDLDGPGGPAAPDEPSEPDETGEATEPGDDNDPMLDVADLEQEGEIAADYVEGLLDIADLDGDIDMDVEGSRAVVSVVGATLDELVGKRGEVLEALQELTRLAVHRQTGERARLMLDVGGYRNRRRAELTEVGRDAADEVKRTGTPKPLAVMTPFERKIVHGAVADVGLRSESEGEEPNRRVVVYPAE